nr:MULTISPECIES: GNAT family N-acetyltransferase [unclassified Sphingomonas]
MLWPGDGIAEQCRQIADALAAGEDHVAFVAVDGNVVLGFAEASIRRDLVNGCDTSPVAFLEAIAVDAAHRRRGVAAMLGRAVEDWGRGRGCTELGSDADEENAEGHALHRAIGFEERERVVFYRKWL